MPGHHEPQPDGKGGPSPGVDAHRYTTGASTVQFGDTEPDDRPIRRTNRTQSRHPATSRRATTSSRVRRSRALRKSAAATSERWGRGSISVAAQPAASATEPIVPIPLFSVICSLGCRAGMHPVVVGAHETYRRRGGGRCSTANRARCVGSGVGVALVVSGVRKDLASQGANSGTVAGAAVLVERFSAD